MKGDWLEEHLERKHVNPFLLIAFLALSVVGVFWEWIRGKM